jgi:transposase
MGGAAPLLPSAKLGGHPRSRDLRRILDAICYMVRSGCAWRLLPGASEPSAAIIDSHWVKTPRARRAAHASAAPHSRRNLLRRAHWLCLAFSAR